MTKENVGLKGWVHITVLDKDGNVKDEVNVNNLIVNGGKAIIAGLIGGLSTSAFTYVAIGTGTTAAAATDTALGTEVVRKAGTTSQVTTTVTDDTYQVVATFSSADSLTGTAAITESGLFDASTGGNMLNRTTFAAVNVDWDAGDSLQITWKVQVQ